MDLAKTLVEINQNREQNEACFIMCLWKQPELFLDYLKLNEGKDKSIRSKDGEFYFNLGKGLYKEGFRNYDPVTLETYLANKPEIKKEFDQRGGYHEIDEMMSMVNSSNLEAYYDQIDKMNFLSDLAKSNEKIFTDVHRFDNVPSSNVYEAFEYQLNNISTNSTYGEKQESLVVDKKFLEALESGENVGFNYGRFAPILNYTTLGLAPGSLFMVAGHSGTGKSSWVFQVMILGMHYHGIKCAVISNEMESSTYKIMLLEHILTNELDYYGITRKQIRTGKYTKEQAEKISEAAKISEEKYSDIVFLKLYDNSISKVLKHVRKLKGQGVSAIFWDTFKSDDDATTENLWQSLMLDARKLFQTANKLNIGLITTYQLGLSYLNTRYLTATCLSNSKQIKEVYENMLYMRPVWDDEFPGEKYDIHPYRLNKDNPKIHEEITMSKDKKYYIFFVDKTRSDDSSQTLLYEWNPRFNKWKELGFAKVINDHR